MRKNRSAVLPALLLAFVLSSHPDARAAEADLGLSGKELIERLARIETKLEEGQKNLQQQINGLQRQIDELKNFVLCSGASGSPSWGCSPW